MFALAAFRKRTGGGNSSGLEAGMWVVDDLALAEERRRGYTAGARGRCLAVEGEVVRS